MKRLRWSFSSPPGILEHAFEMARANARRKEIVLCAYGRTCSWCSTPLRKANATVDHVRCVIDGGSNWTGNLIPSCLDCNRERGRAPARDWLVRCLEEGREVRIELVRSAIERSETHPRCDRLLDTAHRLREQRLRSHALTMATALEGLLAIA